MCLRALLVVLVTLALCHQSNAAVVTCSSSQTNCATCADETPSCTACYSGKPLFPNNTCGVCSIDDCATCVYDSAADAVVCERCHGNFKMNGAKTMCKGCSYGCNNCSVWNEADDTLMCTSCSANFGHKADDSGCVPCPSSCNGCDDSDSNGVPECKACKKPESQVMRPDKNGCWDCSSGCTACTATNQGPECTGCKDASQTVHPDLTHCFSCASLDVGCNRCTLKAGPVIDNCTSCIEGYYLKSNGSGCEACSTIFSNCSRCSAPEAPATAPTCDVCDTSYFLSFANDSCSQCSLFTSNCATCEDDRTDDNTTNTVCLTCDDNFSLASNKTCTDCSAAVSKCSECHLNGTQDTICDKCMDRHVLHDGSCVPCGSNCSSCTTTNGTAINCTDCDPEYGEDAQGVCQACPAECARCGVVDNVFTCTECKMTTIFKADRAQGCEACTEGCSACSNGLCDSCEPGYKLKTDKSACVKCPSGCSECDVSANCTVCEPHNVFRENTMNGCQHCFNAGCGACANGTCTDCLSERTMRDDKLGCFSCRIYSAGCISCESGTNNLGAPVVTECKACDDGYVLNSTSKTCQKCPDGCLICAVEDSSTVCKKCFPDSALKTDGSACVPCSSKSAQCTKCTLGSDNDVNRCTMCVNGYVAMADGSGCTDCRNITDCQACVDENSDGIPDKCTKCYGAKMVANDTQSCAACSTLDNSCSECNDPPVTCVSCNNGFHVSNDKLRCTLECYECDSFTSGCEKKLTNTNIVNTCSLDDPVDACWVSRINTGGEVQYERGCGNETCPKSLQEGLCTTVTENHISIEKCYRCCRGHHCNDFDVQGSSGAEGFLVMTCAELLRVVIVTLLSSFLNSHFN